jgi:hypothetical protein
MKLRFGEFPEDHFLPLITRPFVEWTFKFIGWLLLTSTIQFAYEKTGNQFLLYLKWFCYALILAFIGACVDWFLSFKRDGIISGKKIVAAAVAGPAASSGKNNWVSKSFGRLRKTIIVIVSVVLTLVLVGASNIATDKVIEAFIEFQKAK